MDSRASQEPHQPSRRRSRASRSSHLPLKRPGANAEADQKTFVGEIGDLAVHPGGGMAVWLVRRGLDPDVLVPAELFPSPEWIQQNRGRWAACKIGRLGKGLLIPSPRDLCREETDPATQDVVLLCAACPFEVGRVKKSGQDLPARDALVRMEKTLMEHLKGRHPELLGPLAEA